MNSKVIYLLIFVGVWVFSACQSPQDRVVPVQYKSVFEVDTCLSPTELPMEQNIRTGSLLRLEDKLLAFGDYDRVRIYSYPDLAFVRLQQLPRNVSEVVIGNELFLEDQGEVTGYRLDVQDSLVPSGSSFTLLRVPYSISFQPLGADRYVIPDNYDLDGTSEFHIVNLKTKAWESGGEYPDSPTRFKRLRDFKLAYAHSLSARPDGSAFAVAYTLLRLLHIYDADRHLLHAIKLDYAPGNHNLVDPDFEYRYWNTLDIIATNSYIYLLNPEQPFSGPTQAYSEIVILDWEGNLKVRYRMDRFVYSMIVDEERKVIVGCGNDGTGNTFFELDILADL